MRILIVEDDHTLRRALAVALRARGDAVSDVTDGRAALRAVGSRRYDVVLLDLGLPDMDGIQLLPDLRRNHVGPIVVVSARRDQSDKVAALNAGADDYMTKPFGLPELVARMRAVARRSGVGALVRTRHFSVDLMREEVLDADGGVIGLSATEWAVLAALAGAGGAPVPAEELLQRVWGAGGTTHLNYVRVYIYALRKKLEPTAGSPDCVLSHPGRGYWLAVVD